MNKKILEAAEKAGILIHDGSARATEYGGNTDAVEKFAKLIIDECVNVCLSQRDPQNLNYKPSVKFADEIKRHFW